MPTTLGLGGLVGAGRGFRYGFEREFGPSDVIQGLQVRLSLLWLEFGNLEGFRPALKLRNMTELVTYRS